MKAYPLNEQKLVYRILHQHLAEHPELMDCSILEDLQSNLQKCAQQDGVDVTDHGQWDDWLGNESFPCDVRMQHRRVIDTHGN